MSDHETKAPTAENFDAHDAARASRLELADYLQRVHLDDWNRPSLCEGWTVVDVVAHLSMSTTLTGRDFLFGMVKNLGNFERWNARTAQLQAQRHPPQELVAILRSQADSRAHMPGSSTLDQLVDLLVHGQDISRAIGSPLNVATLPCLAALNHACASRFYGAKKRFSNINLFATDTPWQSGMGSILQGPVLSLLLLATGRKAALDDVEGPGLDIVRNRLDPR